MTYLCPKCQFPLGDCLDCLECGGSYVWETKEEKLNKKQGEENK